MVFIYHVLPCSESTGGFWHAGGDSEKRQCSQKATGCTLSPCSEDVTIDFLYLRKIINSVPLSLAVSYSAHPAGKCCSRAGKETASWVASPSKHREKVQLCPFQLSCTPPRWACPSHPPPLHCRALHASGEGQRGVNEAAALTSTDPACIHSWHFSFLKFLFAEEITLLCGFVCNLFWTCKNLI